MDKPDDDRSAANDTANAAMHQMLARIARTLLAEHPPAAANAALGALYQRLRLKEVETKAVSAAEALTVLILSKLEKK